MLLIRGKVTLPGPEELRLYVDELSDAPHFAAVLYANAGRCLPVAALYVSLVFAAADYALTKGTYSAHAFIVGFLHDFTEAVQGQTVASA